MPRQAIGARLYFDESRQTYVIRDGRKFIRTGVAGRKQAEQRLKDYLRDCPIDRQRRAFAASKPVQGFVYFITADFPDFPVKIGFTEKRNDLRSKSLQTGCPYPLRTLVIIPGTYGEERALHRRFASQRLQGEWFARTPDLLNLIKEKQQ